MPPLSVARHENIAVAIADGKSMRAACEANGVATGRLSGDVAARVHARVAEIQAEREAVVTTQTASAISRVVKTREELHQRILDLIDKAEQRNDLGVALRGMELLGKDIGMFVQRIQSTNEHTILQQGDDTAVRDELDDIFGSPGRPSADEGGGGGVVQGPDNGGEAEGPPEGVRTH